MKKSIAALAAAAMMVPAIASADAMADEILRFMRSDRLSTTVLLGAGLRRLVTGKRS